MWTKAEIIFVFLITSLSIQPSVAQLTNPVLENWYLLASRPIDYSLKRDSIHLNESKEYFTSLKFLVKNDAIQIRKCTVYFTDGTQKDVECIDKSIDNDGCLMNLIANYEAIDKVLFWYDAVITSEKRAVLEIWSKK
jgi:hypothetical protein